MALITAARINNLQSRIALVLGNGAGENGYGQTLLSSQVSNQGGIIDADDMNNIYADILKARVHQVGPGDISIAQVIEDQNIVGEEDSDFISDSGIVTNDADGEKKGIADYETLMTSVETDKAIVHASQAVSEAAIASVRTNVWNGLIYHQVDVTFTDEDHRRHFFNSGGQIIFNATLISGTGAKFDEWVGMLNTTIVKFEHNSTLDQSNSVLTNIGNYDLTSQYQTIGQRQGTGSYSENLYKIYARQTSTSVLQFKVEFNDADTGGSAGSFIGDEPVSGTLTNSISQRRATGSNVSITTPAYNTVTKLE